MLDRIILSLYNVCCFLQYFCRFELENMSIYEILPALGLKQSTHAEIPPLPKWKRSHDFEQEIILSDKAA